jgi:hypothetical protein
VPAARDHHGGCHDEGRADVGQAEQWHWRRKVQLSRKVTGLQGTGSRQDLVGEPPHRKSWQVDAIVERRPESGKLAAVR